MLLYLESFEMIDVADDLIDLGSFTSFNGTPDVFTSSPSPKDGAQCIGIQGNERMLRSMGTGPSIFYISFWFQYNHARTSEFSIIRFFQGSTSNIFLRLKTDGTMVFENAANAEIGSPSTGIFLKDEWHHIEIKMKYADSITLGDVVLSVDGNIEITLPSGTDTKFDTTTTVDRFELMTTSGIGDYHYFDSIIAWTDDTDNGDGWIGHKGQLRIETLIPDGEGHRNDFVGSDANSVDNYLLVDDPGLNDDDTTYSEGSTDTDGDFYTYPALSAPISSIESVVMQTVAKKTSGTDMELVFTPYISATEYAGAAHTLVEDTYTLATLVSSINPDTSDPWTEADVNGTEFGLVRSDP